VLVLLLVSMGVPASNAQNSGENLQSAVQISKSSTNSYQIVNETAYIKPFFDISYIISGSSNLLNNSQSIINSTIINDFLSSPTAGYIMQQNNSSNPATNATNVLPALPNPFVNQETISVTIQQQLSEAINSAIDIDNFDSTVFFYMILITICNNKSNRMATISILYLTIISIGHKNLLIFLHYVMTYTLLTFQLIITAINLYDI